MAKVLNQLTVIMAKNGLVLRKGEMHEEQLVRKLEQAIYEHFRDLQADDDDDSSYDPEKDSQAMSTSDEDEGSAEDEPSGESLDSDE